MVSRRSFLKFLGVSAAAAVLAPTVPKLVTTAPSAPLFIPSERLDLGVPRRILTATELPSSTHLPLPPGPTAEERMRGQTIPMLLLQSNVIPQYAHQTGSIKMPAGTELLVDPATAARWLDRGIATPGPSAPIEMQREHAQRRLQRQQAARLDRYPDFRMSDAQRI